MNVCIYVILCYFRCGFFIMTSLYVKLSWNIMWTKRINLGIPRFWWIKDHKAFCFGFFEIGIGFYFVLLIYPHSIFLLYLLTFSGKKKSIGDVDRLLINLFGRGMCIIMNNVNRLLKSFQLLMKIFQHYMRHHLEMSETKNMHYHLI